MSEENIVKLEKALQAFVDAEFAGGEGHRGLVNDYFLAIGYTRIDENGEQPFGRRYISSTNPFGALGVARLCILDAQQKMKAYQNEDE